MDWGKKWLVDFNAGKTELVLFDQSYDIDSIDVKMCGSVLEEKTSFQMLGLTFSSKLDWGSCIISNAKTVSKKIGTLIHSMNFFSPQVALYLYKSTIRPCMECCCHMWAGAPSCCFELLDNLLLLLNAWLIIKMWLAYVFSIVITLVDVLHNWLTWFHFHFLREVYSLF